MIFTTFERTDSSAAPTLATAAFRAEDVAFALNFTITVFGSNSAFAELW